MEIDYSQKIAQELNLEKWQVYNVLSLLSYGATIPFISRYRKDRTGGLDEVAIDTIQKRYEKLKEIDKRRQYILKSIEKQGKLTSELKHQIQEAESLSELEDIYLPYKPKRRTKASIAEERGLAPLAELIFKQKNIDIQKEASKFLNNEVKDVQEAISGAIEIIAAKINENVQARAVVRNLFKKYAKLKAVVKKGKEAEGIKYRDYFSFEQELKRVPSHRILAIYRAVREKILNMDIYIDKELAIERLNALFIKNDTPSAQIVKKAIERSYTGLIKPSMQNEFKALAKERADEEAIKIFAENLKNLLLSPPLKNKRVLAIDPGFTTGCKVVCLDENGKLLFNTTVYPHTDSKKTVEAVKTISRLTEQYKIDVIALGNGTASKETEAFLKKIRFKRKIKIYIVDESGASVYSTSKVAREEFPDYDVYVRGAVSIGRRLIDPLSELVKIDPKSIGVGQYQHDVDQKKLKQALDNTVQWVVNRVGVNLNTASKYLLTYVSGLGEKLAENIVKYREQNGNFTDRNQLKNVKLMGEKAFEQAAGFLRIPEAENPLDNTAVHPETYYIVENMARDLGVSTKDLIRNEKLLASIEPEKYVDEKFGIQTIKDIIQELAMPNRDPRESFKRIVFAPNINTIDDIQEGMILPGIVKNVTKFGAFVDIGIKINGLVHISQLANRFISDPTQIVKVNQHVKVKVLSVDKERKRISLSMKDVNQD